MMQRLKRRLACWLLPDLASMLREPHSKGEPLEIRIEGDRMWVNDPGAVLFRAWDMPELRIIYNGIDLHGFKFGVVHQFGQLAESQHEPLRVDTPPVVMKLDPWGFPCA